MNEKRLLTLAMNELRELGPALVKHNICGTWEYSLARIELSLEGEFSEEDVEKRANANRAEFKAAHEAWSRVLAGNA